MSTQLLNTCLACGGDDLYMFLDLGTQELANSFHRPDEVPPAYPLAVNTCRDCYHVQLTHAVSPDELFKNYLYVSGTTRTLTDYFSDFVDRVEKRYPGQKLRVLDIASNDGSLLKVFKAKGHQVLGVDPAQNLKALAEANGIEVICDYWSEDFAKKLNLEFDVIVAMNVFAHVSNPLGFLKGIRQCLGESGTAYIQTSQAEMIKNFEFDTIYHEHHSFFNTKSFDAICKRADVVLSSVEKVPIHGISYLWEVKKQAEKVARPSVELQLDMEGSLGYFELPTYIKFGESAREISIQVRRLVDQYRNQGFTVCGYGAAAKANTFLNYSKLRLDFIVDDNPLKHNLLSPGMNIPVVNIEHFKNMGNPVLCLILAWNFYGEIRSRLKAVRENKDDRFFTYFPRVQIEQ